MHSLSGMGFVISCTFESSVEQESWFHLAMMCFRLMDSIVGEVLDTAPDLLEMRLSVKELCSGGEYVLQATR